MFRKKLTGNRIIWVSFTVLLIMTMTMLFFKKKKATVEDYEDPEADGTIYLGASLPANSIGDPPQNIFFLETSNSSTLSVRQACAVESAARENPSMSVHVVINATGTLHVNMWMAALLSLHNVVIKMKSLQESFLNSPLEEWYRRGKWKKSPYKVAHLSDALRMLVIWQEGGIYMDLDVLVLRSLAPLNNVMIAESKDSIANAVFSFKKRSNFLFQCLQDFQEHYSESVWSGNGPAVFTRNFKKVCNMQRIVMGQPLPCGVTVLPPVAAYPIPYPAWRKYFDYTPQYNISEYFTDSYVVHLWNRLSVNTKPGNGTFYDLLMKSKCPLVTEAARLAH